MEVIKKTTIKALNIQNGKVLFVLDNDGLWELPGGTQESGESDQDTLKRELKEELDIKVVDIGDFVLAEDFSVPKPEWDKEYIFSAKIYKADFDASNAKLSDEHKEIKWFTLDELLKINTREVYRNAVLNSLVECHPELVSGSHNP